MIDYWRFFVAFVNPVTIAQKSTSETQVFEVLSAFNIKRRYEFVLNYAIRVSGLYVPVCIGVGGGLKMVINTKHADVVRFFYFLYTAFDCNIICIFMTIKQIEYDHRTIYRGASETIRYWRRS